jgi:hypothetical protein
MSDGAKRAFAGIILTWVMIAAGAYVIGKQNADKWYAAHPKTRVILAVNESIQQADGNIYMPPTRCYTKRGFQWQLEACGSWTAGEEEPESECTEKAQHCTILLPETPPQQAMKYWNVRR